VVPHFQGAGWVGPGSLQTSQKAGAVEENGAILAPDFPISWHLEQSSWDVRFDWWALSAL
jgi:hypothetical protein